MQCDFQFFVCKFTIGCSIFSLTYLCIHKLDDSHCYLKSNQAEKSTLIYCELSTLTNLLVAVVTTHTVTV